jgi:hypothetical protein
LLGFLDQVNSGNRNLVLTLGALPGLPLLTPFLLASLAFAGLSINVHGQSNVHFLVACRNRAARCSIRCTGPGGPVPLA